ITSFNPNSGPVGTTVTLTGTNYSTTPANNIVKFNGVTATIVGTPTITSIVTMVPVGATTGAITVEVGGDIGTSATNFTVTAPDAPTVTGFSPPAGPVGTSISITGSGFSATPADNIVYFGATKAVVSAATTTSMTVTVPIGATYQPISVQTYELTGFSYKPFLPTFTGGNGIV